MGSTGTRSRVTAANPNVGRRVRTGYTTRISGRSGVRGVEVYSNTKAQANAVAERSRKAGNRTRTTSGRRRTR